MHEKIVDMCARHGRVGGAIEICLSEKGALAKKIGKHCTKVWLSQWRRAERKQWNERLIEFSHEELRKSLVVEFMP